MSAPLNDVLVVGLGAIGSICSLFRPLWGAFLASRHHQDRVTLGMYRHGDHLATSNTAEESVILDDFGAMLKAGGIELTIVPEIQRHKFSKTFWNFTFTSFSTLANSPLTAMFRPPPNVEEGHSCTPYIAPVTESFVREETWPVLQSTLQEMIVLGRAMGFPDEEGGLPSSLVA